MANEIQAVFCTAVGTAEIKAAPKPTLPPGYLLVKTKAVALNPTDWKTIHDPSGRAVGTRVGVDFSGIVEEVGADVKQPWKKGDRICGFVFGGKDAESGSFGDYLVATAHNQLKIPDNLSFEEAATLGVAVTTCGQALYQLLSLPLPPAPASDPPRWILVGGGSTATAVVGIQYAKLSGLKVAATASPYNFEYLQSLGVDLLLDYHGDTDDLVKKIRAVTGDDLLLAWDCSPNDKFPKIAGLSLSQTKKSIYATVSPLTPPDFLKETNPLVESKFQLGYTAFGETFTRMGVEFPASKEDADFAEAFWAHSEPLLADGTIKPTRFTLNRGGESWAGVVHGLEELRNGRVSGTKLVYTV